MKCPKFDGDNLEQYVVRYSRMPIADITQRCLECGRTIPKGEQYKIEMAISDDRWVVNKTCLECSSIREHLVESYYWGSLLDVVDEGIRENEKLPWARIGELSPEAREIICDKIEKSWEGDEVR